MTVTFSPEEFRLVCEALESYAYERAESANALDKTGCHDDAADFRKESADADALCAKLEALK